MHLFAFEMLILITSKRLSLIRIYREPCPDIKGARPMPKCINVRRPGVSTSELSQNTDGNRENGEAGVNGGETANGAAATEADIKYEEPVLPNLIILRLIILKF